MNEFLLLVLSNRLITIYIATDIHVWKYVNVYLSYTHMYSIYTHFYIR